MKRQNKKPEKKSGEDPNEKVTKMEKDLNDLIEDGKTRNEAYKKIIKEIEKRINKPD